MPTDYGRDLAALDDLPDTDVLVEGEDNVAYALARRLLQPSGGLEDIGDETPYSSTDVREWLGLRVSAADVRSKEAQVKAILSEDPRVQRVDVSLSFGDRTITIDVDGQGIDGPFGFVLSIDDVTVDLMVNQ